MEYVKCNLCEFDDTELIYERPDLAYFVDKEIYKIVKCKNCGLAYVNPRPNIKEIQKYYPSQFFQSFSDKETLKRYEEEEKYLANLSPGKLLDVGCANGDFPLYMKEKGWQVWGQEIGFHSIATKTFPKCHKILPKCEYNSNFFDAVTAWAVFEHLHDPMSYFKEVSRILKPGGQFIFLVTNSNSLSSSKLFQEDIPRHLYFFSKRTIKEYLRKVELNLKGINFHNNIFSMNHRGIFVYFLKRLFGKGYNWEDSTFSRRKYLVTTGRKPSILTNILFLISHPIWCADIVIISRVVDIISILIRKYGIMIVVAEK